MTPRRLALALVLGAALLLLGDIAVAAARPGGGHSFSGGSRSSYSGGSRSSYSGGSRSSYSGSSYSSSGGGDSSADIAVLMFAGVFIVGGIGSLAVSAIRENMGARREAEQLHDLMSQPPSPAPLRRPIGWSERPRRPQRPRRAKILEHDPDFSRIVFEDLAYRLYVAAYTRAVHGGDLDGLAPYLAPDVRDALRRDLAEHHAVDGVVVGELRSGKVELDDARVSIEVEIQSNVSLSGGPRDETHYLVERWTFARALAARTRPPEQVMTLGCPACGAPFTSTDHRRCSRCDTLVADGRFEWQVKLREVVARRAMAPTITRTIVEVGTDDPTVVHPGLDRQMIALASGPPGGTLDAIAARAHVIFTELNAAWDARDLARMRPVLSDALFDGMRYWLKAADARGQHNRVEQAQLLRIQPARVRRDTYFDAITLRLHAQCLDYTVNRSGAVLAGSRETPRVYSEYWTLIRGRHPGERRDDAGGCPSCGAPMQLTMAGNCEHCGRHLTLGEFDWVLSKIEQDETYRG